VCVCVCVSTLQSVLSGFHIEVQASRCEFFPILRLLPNSSEHTYGMGCGTLILFCTSGCVFNVGDYVSLCSSLV
jgi:hypothetical protein